MFDFKAFGQPVITRQCEVLVLGGGAAGLNCALQLKRKGVDALLISENAYSGTSFNTGSDKQTYCRPDIFDPAGDGAYALAQTLYNGGAVHGDVALMEASRSLQGLYNLMDLGVNFPLNPYGASLGYKTDHDERQRGTSLGPYTSKIMVEKLLKAVEAEGPPYFSQHSIVSLIGDSAHIYGALTLNKERLEEEGFGLEAFVAAHTVLALGGPAGLFADSVYPTAHLGGIGLALEKGAQAANLTESQFGIASLKPRWNLSGTYQQALPYYFSLDSRGREYDFLGEFYDNMEDMYEAVFLKGYQWPFDARKAKLSGSSLIDLLVFQERYEKGRRVFIDFSRNLGGQPFNRELLRPEPFEYLTRSKALQQLPIERLRAMNEPAYQKYLDSGIDLAKEPLEISVCMQHNNGGLDTDKDCRSVNVPALWAIGEINGSHGVYRPGGSALNAGQAAGFACAQFLAQKKIWLDVEAAERASEAELQRVAGLIEKIYNTRQPVGQPRQYRKRFQTVMSRYAGLLRSAPEIGAALKEIQSQRTQWSQTYAATRRELIYALENRHLIIAAEAYLQAIAYYLASGGGSRGSYLALAEDAPELLKQMPYKARTENKELYGQRQTIRRENETWQTCSEICRPIPHEEFWFETHWEN